MHDVEKSLLLLGAKKVKAYPDLFLVKNIQKYEQIMDRYGFVEQETIHRPYEAKSFYDGARFIHLEIEEY